MNEHRGEKQDNPSTHYVKRTAQLLSHKTRLQEGYDTIKEKVG